MSRRVPSVCVGLVAAIVLLSGRTAYADQSVRDVLAFLLTNRSVATGDFVRDEQAAEASSEAIARLLLSELGTVPISSSASGFTYRLDPDLGVNVRSSNNFGPVFVERALTAGRGRMSLAVTNVSTSYTELDGRPLRDGTLVSTASHLAGEPAPFDVETLTLRLRTQATLVSANAGLSDRFDAGVVVPLLRVSLEGRRVDTYRGEAFLQATGSALASGFGDILARAKYNVARYGASGLAVAAEVRLSTGDADDLRGGGETVFTPRVIASYEGARVGVHGNFGVAVGGLSREWQYRGAVSIAAHPRLTIVGEMLGRRTPAAVRLAEIVEPHPTVTDVSTIRLTGTSAAAHQVLALGAVRWNVASAWLLSITVMRPLTTGGLHAPFTPMVTLDYSFGR